jgi:hypothetical protein
VTADQVKAKNAKCMEAATAAKLAEEAEAYYTLVKKAVANQGDISSEAQGQLASAAIAATEASAEIAEKVVEIVRQYHAFDEVGMSCVVKLRMEPDTSKLDFCENLLKQMANTRTAQLKLEEQRLNAERIKEFRSAMESASESMAKSVWTSLGTNFTPSHLMALAEKAGVNLTITYKRKLVRANADFIAFQKVFKKMPVDQQTGLAKAASMP